MLIGGSLAIANSVTKPLRDLAHASQRIAEGDYTEVASTQRGDEISAVTRNFKLMVAAVKERGNRIVFQSNHQIRFRRPRIYRRGGRSSAVTTLINMLNHNYVNDLLTGIGQRISHI
ncbi:MAG: HAMP domain-containing protein [Pseudomonadales bacterium]|nr:HAMP domain-containing protein [Pseudomonadales bacterium]